MDDKCCKTCEAKDNTKECRDESSCFDTYQNCETLISKDDFKFMCGMDSLSKGCCKTCKAREVAATAGKSGNSAVPGSSSNPGCSNSMGNCAELVKQYKAYGCANVKINSHLPLSVTCCESCNAPEPIKPASADSCTDELPLQYGQNPCDGYAKSFSCDYTNINGKNLREVCCKSCKKYGK